MNLNDDTPKWYTVLDDAKTKLAQLLVVNGVMPIDIKLLQENIFVENKDYQFGPAYSTKTPGGKALNQHNLVDKMKQAVTLAMKYGFFTKKKK